LCFTKFVVITRICKCVWQIRLFCASQENTCADLIVVNNIFVHYKKSSTVTKRGINLLKMQIVSSNYTHPIACLRDNLLQNANCRHSLVITLSGAQIECTHYVFTPTIKHTIESHKRLTSSHKVRSTCFDVHRKQNCSDNKSHACSHFEDWLTHFPSVCAHQLCLSVLFIWLPANGATSSKITLFDFQGLNVCFCLSHRCQSTNIRFSLQSTRNNKYVYLFTTFPYHQLELIKEVGITIYYCFMCRPLTCA
jgi:hypothetical protein